MEADWIILKGLREHNLKAINVSIPKRAITVITGVSGSGKSSLAYDSLACEAQRRFFYSLSHYSRHFLEQSQKPQLSSASGLAPAVLLKQNEGYPSKAASIASTSPLGEILGLAFSRFGKQYCPTHNLLTTAQTEVRWADSLISGHANQVIAVCAPLLTQKKGSHQKLLQGLASRGFLRALIDDCLVDLLNPPMLDKDQSHSIKLVLDFVRANESNRARLVRSLEKAQAEGAGYCECFLAINQTKLDLSTCLRFSSRHGCSICSFSWPKLDQRYFSGNSLGRCGACRGLGCVACRGVGIDTSFEFIRIDDKSIHDFMTVDLLTLTGYLEKARNLSEENEAFKLVIDEASRHSRQICDAGLGYLCLSRRLRSLSSGEAQRIRIANLLSEKLRGVIYVCDEPSFGLHPSEIENLLVSLRRLVSYGNTVVVVDHDEDLIKKADWLIELGPGGGKNGGELVYCGTDADSLASLKVPESKAVHSENSLAKDAKFLTLLDARAQNLKIPQVDFCLNEINVITGVSGAGKSSLLWQELYPNAKKSIQDPTNTDSQKKLLGMDDITQVEKIDRRPVSRSGSQIVANYLQVFSDIRLLFSKVNAAQILGLSSRSFSLKVEGGRCDFCRGRGEIYLSMKFLADAAVSCSVCRGSRYKDTILKVRYLGLNISEVLHLCLDEALSLFAKHPDIARPLRAACELGLSYLQLGQSLATLSGGEAQRMKLVPLVASKDKIGRLILMDEPSQGLSKVDVAKLLASLAGIAKAGNTLIIIEHDRQIIQAAKWIVEIGPKSASEGGRLVYAGKFENYPVPTS